MKHREVKELHTKTVDELRAMLKELKNSVGEARLELAQHKLTNTSSLPSMRTDIARVQTILQQKTSQEGGKE